MNRSFTPPRTGGGVQPVIPEFEVVLPDGKLFVDARGQFLLTKPRADLVALNTGGKLWLVPHTPYNTLDGIFSPRQRALFLSARCPYVTVPRLRSDDRYCQMPTAPRADYGYCQGHKSQLPVSGQYARVRDSDLLKLDGKLPCIACVAVNFVVRYSGQCRCSFRYSGR